MFFFIPAKMIKKKVKNNKVMIFYVFISQFSYSSKINQNPNKESNLPVPPRAVWCALTGRDEQQQRSPRSARKQP